MENSEKQYNGWTNYETWVTALWLDNDEGTQNYWREVARECKQAAPEAEQVRDGIWTVDQAAKFALADRLKEEVSEGTPITAEASLYADLLGAALQDVNWDEIAENRLQELNG